MKRYAKRDFPVSDVRRFLEPGPIVLVSSAWRGRTSINGRTGREGRCTPDRGVLRQLRMPAGRHELDPEVQPLHPEGREGPRRDGPAVPADAALPRRRPVHAGGPHGEPLPPVVQARKPLMAPAAIRSGRRKHLRRPPAGRAAWRYSASQTVSSCWFRKWLGMIVQPRTFELCGMMRCHWKPMMKCTSSS